MASACVSNRSPAISTAEKWAISSPEISDPSDFEFRLQDPPAALMLPADELFSQGKLVPLQMSAAVHVSSADSIPLLRKEPASSGVRRTAEICSPKAPRCSSRWRQLLGLRKIQSPTKSPIRDSDTDTDSSASLSSSRFSLSSDSSAELPRISLDSERPSRWGPARVRLSRPAAAAAAAAGRRMSADAESPRMNSCGKVVFDGGSLERSSSGPSSSSGGAGVRVRPRGMERSYSANVLRVNPVLNVPVCSLRGSGKHDSVFGFFSSEKRKDHEKGKGKNSGGNGGKLKMERAARV